MFTYQTALHFVFDCFTCHVGQVSQGGQASDEVCRTPDECVGVPIQGRHSKQAACVRENRARLREPIHTESGRRYQERSDDAGNGGHASQRAPHLEQRQNHKLKSDETGDSLDHENTAVHRQSTNANAARSKSEEQGQGQRKQGQKAKARTARAKERARMQRTNQKTKNDEERKCFCCQWTGHVKADWQKEIGRPCRSRRETGGRIATSFGTTQRRSCRCSAHSQARGHTRQRSSWPCLVRAAKRHASLPVSKP